MKTLLTSLICAAFLLTGCGLWKPSVKPSLTEPVIIPPLPAELGACEGPAELPYDKAKDGILAPEEMLKAWARDRYRLAGCVRQNRIVLSYMERLRTEFAAASK